MLQARTALYFAAALVTVLMIWTVLLSGSVGFGGLQIFNSQENLLKRLNALASARKQEPVDVGKLTPPQNLICAMVFFGQVKNLEPEHVENFAENILEPLMNRCATVEAYLHTYSLTSFTNPRNSEKDVPLDTVGSLELLLDKMDETGVYFVDASFSLTEQGLLAFRSLDYYLQAKDPWGDNPRISMTNYLLQMYSLDRVSELWWPYRKRYSMVVYLRPDLIYRNPLPIPDRIEEDTLYAPDFDIFFGYNDRFGLGTPKVMDVYGHRMRYIEAYFNPPPHAKRPPSFRKSLHAETYLKFSMTYHGFVYQPLKSFNFTRLRATGATKGTR